MKMISIADLVAVLSDRAGAQDRRLMVAVVGAPGAGKTTLAAEIVVALGDTAAVVPMDGFHLDNATLKTRGRLANKGAPDTFDGDAFIGLVAQIANGGACSYPTFDRAEDCVVPGGGKVAASAKIIVFEGNYLLLKANPWAKLADLWDITVLIDVPLEELRRRLIKRWLDHGHSEALAMERAQDNDIPNAELVARNSGSPHFVVQTSKAG